MPKGEAFSQMLHLYAEGSIEADIASDMPILPTHCLFLSWTLRSMGYVTYKGCIEEDYG